MSEGTTWRRYVPGFSSILGIIGWLFGLAIIGLIVFRMMFVNYVDNYELGYEFDARTGEITILDHSGYIVTPPLLVSVHHIDLRPMQVCISAIQRVLNCKLVQFNPDPAAVRLFLSWHGRQNYDGPGIHNSSGSSSGSNDDTLLQNILKAYAYEGSGRNYPFLRVIREIRPDGAPVQ